VLKLTGELEGRELEKLLRDLALSLSKDKIVDLEKAEVEIEEQSLNREQLKEAFTLFDDLHYSIQFALLSVFSHPRTHLIGNRLFDFVQAVKTRLNYPDLLNQEDYVAYVIENIYNKVFISNSLTLKDAFVKILEKDIALQEQKLEDLRVTTATGIYKEYLEATNSQAHFLQRRVLITPTYCVFKARDDEESC